MAKIVDKVDLYDDRGKKLVGDVPITALSPLRNPAMRKICSLTVRSAAVGLAGLESKLKTGAIAGKGMIMLIVIGIVLMLGSLIWEIWQGGEEAVITTIFGATFVILGFLWDMNETLIRISGALKGISGALEDGKKILVEIRDLIRK